MVEPRSKNDDKKKLKREKRGDGALPLRSFLTFFYFVFAPFEFRRPEYLETKPEKKKYIRVQTKTDTSGRGFYFNWGTKRRMKMTEVQLEKIDYVTGGLTRVEITF